MSTYNEDWVTQLKNNSNIVSVASKYISLQRKGRRYWACCPFHFEKTPSFAIDEIKQTYHCYGCGVGGDVISFVRKYENIEFMEACKIVAKDCNFTIPEKQYDETIVARKKKADRMYALLRDATTYYHNNLKDTPLAQEYIEKRQLDDDTVKQFGIGYSKDWTGIIDALKAKGYTLNEMQESGLVECKNYRNFDCYAGRLMFPIINVYGNVVGFSGRVLEDKGFAKYKNTQQTNLGFKFTSKESSDLFDKSKCLYGIYQLKKFRQTQNIDEIILVEGQMDVISLYRNGVKNAVASLGTAFTPMHIKELKRFCNKVVLCFDGDDAGVKATLRTIEILTTDPAMQVYAVHLPEKLDPDEFVIKYGKEKFFEVIHNAKYWVEYLIRKLAREHDLTKPDGKNNFIEKALEVVKKLDTLSEREIYIKMISEIAKINEKALMQDLGTTDKKEEVAVEYTKENAYVKAVKFVMSALLYKKDYAILSDDIRDNILNFDIRQLYDMIAENNDINISSLKSAFDTENNQEIKEIMDFMPAHENDNQGYFNDCVKTIKNNGLLFRQAQVLKEIKEENDPQKKKELYTKLNEINLKLRGK